MTTSTVACEQCGASLTVEATTAVVSCAHCGHSNPLSVHVREQLQRAQAEVDETDAITHAGDALRKRLLRPAIVALFGGGLGEMLGLLLWLSLGWALGTVAGELFGRPGVYERGSSLFLASLALWSLPVALCFGVYVALRRRHLAQVRAAAAARLADDGSFACRNCAARLQASRDQRVFVPCSFCGTQNLLDSDAVARREAMLRKQQGGRLEQLRKTEVRIQGTTSKVVLSLTLAPILIGFALNPLYEAALSRLAPFIPAPPSPPAWVDAPTSIAAIEVDHGPWPIVAVDGYRESGTIHVEGADGARPVEVSRLRAVPLWWGLRLIERRRQEPAMIDDSGHLRLAGPWQRYGDDLGPVVALDCDELSRFSVVPTWSSEEEYDAYFDFADPPPLPEPPRRD